MAARRGRESPDSPCRSSHDCQFTRRRQCSTKGYSSLRAKYRWLERPDQPRRCASCPGEDPHTEWVSWAAQGCDGQVARLANPGCGLGCAMELTSEEGRVLGCLVEKQLTTPQLYPLTESALIAACNQSTNRNPVVVYDVSTVRITTRGLRE